MIGTGDALLFFSGTNNQLITSIRVDLPYGPTTPTYYPNAYAYDSVDKTIFISDESSVAVISALTNRIISNITFPLAQGTILTMIYYPHNDEIYMVSPNTGCCLYAINAKTYALVKNITLDSNYDSSSLSNYWLPKHLVSYLRSWQ